MSARRDPVRYAVFQIGALESEVRTAIDRANQMQHEFNFDFQERRFSLAKKYRCKNGGYDLELAISTMLRSEHLPRPALFVTSEPYTDFESADDPDGFFFSYYRVQEGVAVISTYPWHRMPQPRATEPYILFTLGSLAFAFCANLREHDKTRNCPFDYCNDIGEIDKGFQAAALCQECSSQLDRALRTGKATIEQAAAAQRLLNLAADRKQAFVAMPFCKELKPVYVGVKSLLENHNWRVLRADDVSYPRSITAAIFHLILASDLVIAEVTESNANVFYELGWAHGVGQDVLLLIQKGRELPFDIKTERAIMYTPNEEGVAEMLQRLSQLVGILAPQESVASPSHLSAEYPPT